MLRVLGADRRQVAQTVAFEALVMGAVAAVVGYGLGLVVSRAISGAVAAAGAEIPIPEFMIGGGPIVAALALGVGLTVIIAILPAMLARRVTPMVALADDADIDPYSRHRSIIIGSVVGGIGLVLLVVCLLSELSTSVLVLLLGFGALGMLVGVNICSPAVAGPMSQVLGWPAARVFSLNGRLARDERGAQPPPHRHHCFGVDDRAGHGVAGHGAGHILQAHPQQPAARLGPSGLDAVRRRLRQPGALIQFGGRPRDCPGA